MFKVRSEARCPETYYKEIMMTKDFNKMTKMQLVAFININSDEDNQVTLRPRKSTLVRLAEDIQYDYERDEMGSDKAELMAMCEKELDPKKGDSPLDTFVGRLVLTIVFGFFGIIGLEFIRFWFFEDIPMAHILGVFAVAFLLIGIPLRVITWEMSLRRLFLDADSK